MQLGRGFLAPTAVFVALPQNRLAPASTLPPSAALSLPATDPKASRDTTANGNPAARRLWSAGSSRLHCRVARLSSKIEENSMTIRTPLAALAGLLLLGAAGPALAAAAKTPQLPADANKTLWCASAFTLVEPQARAAGQTAAADNFLAYAKTLNAQSAASMSKAGFTDEEIKSESGTYTAKVAGELNPGGKPEFSVVACTELVDPAKAAAMQPGAAPAPKSDAPKSK
jgi:hypothetical protein